MEGNPIQEGNQIEIFGFIQLRKGRIYMKKIVLSAVIGIILCLMLSLAVIYLIPQKAVKKQIEESAHFLVEKELFPYIKQNTFNTRQDNYADAILLNIIYYSDSSKAWRSVLEAPFYKPEVSEVNDNLLKAVKENPKPNAEYSRYWHGSMVFLRPLLCVMNLQQIRIFLTGIVIAMLGISNILLIKRGVIGFVVSLLIGFLIINGWMIAFSLEYVMTFLVMSVALLAVILTNSSSVSDEKKRNRIGYIFALSGVFTCFVDFLTTETLSFTIPMLVLLVLQEKNGQLKYWKDVLKQIVLYGLIFMVSYACMFFLKWILATITIGKKALDSAIGSVMERSIGTVTMGQSTLDPSATTLQKLGGALWKNIGCLFPFKEMMSAPAVYTALFCCILFLFSCVYLFHGTSYYSNLGMSMLLLSLIPFLRFLLLSNHSYLHYFFTYRALLVSVVGAIYYTGKCCEEYWKRRWKRQWKRI